MRFLHTADWHLGKTLRGRSRDPEHEAVLSEILDIAVREEVDCLLVSGDVFDSHIPSPEAERLAYGFLAELLGNRIPAVIIGGNHDHPRRLAALRQLVERLEVFVRPEPCPPNAGGVISLDCGDERARIAVLPFVSERKIIGAAQLLLPEQDVFANYAERVGAMLEHLGRGLGSETINLLLGHLFMRGGEASGSERAIHVSRPYEVSAQRLPPVFQYVALGHLHRPQELDAPARALYAGSILQLDFGEQNQEKRVVLVDAKAGQPAKVRSVPLTAGRRLLEVRASLDELRQVAEDHEQAWLRVVLRVPAPSAGLSEQVREVLPNALDVQIDYPRKTEQVNRPDLGRVTPEELFRDYYRARHETEIGEPLLKLFRELYQEAMDASDPVGS